MTPKKKQNINKSYHKSPNGKKLPVIEREGFSGHAKVGYDSTKWPLPNNFFDKKCPTFEKFLKIFWPQTRTQIFLSQITPHKNMLAIRIR